MDQSDDVVIRLWITPPFTHFPCMCVCVFVCLRTLAYVGSV